METTSAHEVTQPKAVRPRTPVKDPNPSSAKSYIFQIWLLLVTNNEVAPGISIPFTTNSDKKAAAGEAVVKSLRDNQGLSADFTADYNLNVLIGETVMMGDPHSANPQGNLGLFQAVQGIYMGSAAVQAKWGHEPPHPSAADLPDYFKIIPPSQPRNEQA